MDEPFSALDPITREKIRKEFRELDELKNKTILMVTHDVQEAFEMADKIGLMNEGSIIDVGSLSEILLRKQHTFVSQFLNEQQLMLELKAVPINKYWAAIISANNPADSDSRYNSSQSL